ncbi:MAG: S-layer homology domain-containing protein [Oscillospiraceae bacterium]|jgi:D-alanyl-D-alanine carboxypeptidase|nr:S-layer homology domain-containing protein [Oscillospiraceae bacterium]
MKKLRRTLGLALALLLLLMSLPSAFAATVGGKYVAAQGLFILDYDTGLELYSQNADMALVPASMTKVMSVYLMYEALERGEIAPDTVVPISEKVYRLSHDYSYINTAPLSYTDTYYVDEMIDLILVFSASASVVAMAELISGSEEAFVERMNAKASELGINATYYDCAGIKDNYITPRSMALLASRLITDYPLALDITKKPSTTFHGVSYKSTNLLLADQYYEGADGLKTGTTNAAGCCFTGTAVRNGVRLITVVMKSPSNIQRYIDTKTLLDYGFSIRDGIVRDATMRLAPFTDVYTDDWYAEAVTNALETGLMQGTSATTFSPHSNLTRAMTATILWRLAGKPEAAVNGELRIESGEFSDVLPGAYYYDAVRWASSEGIVEGTGEGLFTPDANVTRRELATMLYRFAGIGEDGWDGEAMRWAQSERIINDGRPEDLTNRAECAAIIMRFALR